VDPTLDGATADAQQAAGFEENLHAFFAWCVKDAVCATTFSASPAKAFAALFARFKRGYTEPTSDGTRVNYGIALQGVLAALYSKSTWPVLSQALASAKHGDGSELALFAYALNGLSPDGSFSNIVSANAATTCLDVSNPTTVRQHVELARRLSRSAPDF